MDEFVPFLDDDVEIRRVICSTNAVESINARYRCAIRARGYFPTEQAALECLYMVTRSLDPAGRGKARFSSTKKKTSVNASVAGYVPGRMVGSHLFSALIFCIAAH